MLALEEFKIHSNGFTDGWLETLFNQYDLNTTINLYLQITVDNEMVEYILYKEDYNV